MTPEQAREDLIARMTVAWCADEPNEIADSYWSQEMHKVLDALLVSPHLFGAFVDVYGIDEILRRLVDAGTIVQAGWLGAWTDDDVPEEFMASGDPLVDGAAIQEGMIPVYRVRRSDD